MQTLSRYCHRLIRPHSRYKAQRSSTIHSKTAWTRTARPQPGPTRWGIQASASQQTRAFRDEAISSLLSYVPPALVPPTLFVGLVIALWTIKCINMVLFQNKIIYMPNMPPFARNDKIEDYQKECGVVRWREERIKSLDGTRIALCIGEVGGPNARETRDISSSRPPIVMLYFQGNGASSPPRMPLFSRAMRDVASKCDTDVTLVALSYRGYWNSSGRPSQKGIELDALAFLDWAQTTFSGSTIVVWGQSLGAGVALRALSQRSQEYHDGSSAEQINGVILETPFVSLRRMLVALYPQKWLPYRRLWPFLWNHWDSEQALTELAAGKKGVPRTLLLLAADDEIVPKEEGDYLETHCKRLGVRYRRVDVRNAFHNDASSKGQGRQSIAGFIASLRASSAKS